MLKAFGIRVSLRHFVLFLFLASSVVPLLFYVRRMAVTSSHHHRLDQRLSSQRMEGRSPADLKLTSEHSINATAVATLEKQATSSVPAGRDIYVAPVVPRTVPPGQPMPFITAPVSGKMGNRMFQYAALLGVAHLNGMEPFYKTSSRLNTFFQVSHVREGPVKNFKVVNEKHFASYDSKFETLPQTDTTIAQYFQSWKYFHFIRDTIRKEFTFKQNVKDAASKLLSKHAVVIGNKTRVGVHVRRGDMLMTHHIRKGYHVAPASYLLKAMDLMRQKHGDVIFVVVTDDAKWCRNVLESKSSDLVIADSSSAEVHMAVLTSCDHVIMTVGTYGWWGGYLSGGDVVYYWDSQQLLHQPPLPVEIQTPEDFYLPHWTPLTG